MSLASFPSIREPSIATKPEFYKPQVQVEFEANYVSSWPKVSRGRRKWTLLWPYLSEADYQTLEDFFDDNQGGMFTWTHPITNTGYTCMFSVESIICDEQVPGYRSNVQIGIQEV
jgi:hypothetical protein